METDSPLLYRVDQLVQICQHAPQSRLASYLPFLNDSLETGEVNSEMRLAMYAAQLAHESAEFRYLEELASGEAYDINVNRGLAFKLGNVTPGDGVKYKGRGPIQITGRKNYADVSVALGQDFITRPWTLAFPANAFKSSAWWWKQHGCNVPADAGDVEACTRIINGGTNGLEQRQMYYDRACEVLGC